MITATKPFSPPVELYQAQVAEIFSNNWFTNHGPKVTKLETDLKKYFNVPYLVMVSNGTIALQIAIKALELSGEIITTPYSYVATTSTIVWESCIPRFADINRKTLNIDPESIRKAINSKTKAIIATNVYGYPCDFEAIKIISEEHNIPVIYDNAHGFSSKFKGKDILNYGDISTISFHATKLFHSIEGGAIICQDEKTYKKILLLRNFGHTSPISFDGAGINGKMNELCAAMGLVNMEFIDQILQKRKEQWLYYSQNLTGVNVEIRNYDLKDIDYNCSYFPILFETESKLLSVLQYLEEKNIFARRYFNPSLNTLNYIVHKDPCPVSEDVSSRVMCLPLYHELTIEEQNYVLEKLKEVC